MAYLMTHFWPGGTQDQYSAMTAAIHPPDGLPPGQIHHAAGPTDGGFLISALWDSKDSADAFVANTLVPALPVDGGFAGQPEQRTAEVINLQSS
jgi:hypothetical protein